MRRYDKCALDFNGRAWCPTKTYSISDRRFQFGPNGGYPTEENTDTWNKWGYCSEHCPVTPGPGGELIHTQEIVF